MKNHILWPPERAKKKSMLSYESKFSRYMKNMGNTAFLNGNVRFWSVYIFYKNFWVKNKDAILFTSHFDLGRKENSLKIDLDTVELSGKTALISTKLRPPQKTIISFELIISLGSRRLSAKQNYFLSILSVKCSGAFCGFGSQLALLWPLNLASAYLLLVCDTKWPVTTRKTIRDFIDLYAFLIQSQ